MRRLSVATVATVATVAALAAGCATTVPVNRPCGVIADSLKDVRGARSQDRQRIDVHFERGVRAGCWKR